MDRNILHDGERLYKKFQKATKYLPYKSNANQIALNLSALCVELVERASIERNKLYLRKAIKYLKKIIHANVLEYSNSTHVLIQLNNALSEYSCFSLNLTEIDANIESYEAVLKEKPETSRQYDKFLFELGYALKKRFVLSNNIEYLERSIATFIKIVERKIILAPDLFFAAWSLAGALLTRYDFSRDKSCLDKALHYIITSMQSLERKTIEHLTLATLFDNIMNKRLGLNGSVNYHDEDKAIVSEYTHLNIIFGTNYFKRGLKLFKKSEFHSARPFFEISTQYYLAALNNESEIACERIGLGEIALERIALAYNNLGCCYLEIEDFEKSRKSLIEGIKYIKDMLESGRSDMREEYVSALVNLSSCLIILDEHDLAFNAVEESIRIVDDLISEGYDNQYLRRITAYQNMAKIYSHSNNYTSAMEAYQCAQKTIDNLEPEEQDKMFDSQTETYIALATHLFYNKNYHQARSIYPTLLDKLNSALSMGYSKYSVIIPVIQAHYGVCFMETGDLATSRQLLESAIESLSELIEKNEIIAEDFDNKVSLYSLSNMYTWLGSNLELSGEIAQSLRAFESSLEIYKKNELGGIEDPRFITLGTELANCYRRIGDFEVAIDMYKSAIQEYERHSSNQKLKFQDVIALAKMNLANCYRQQTNLALARELYESSLNEYDDLIKKGNENLVEDRALCRTNLIHCLLEEKDFKAAIKVSVTNLSEYENLINSEARSDLKARYTTALSQFGLLQWIAGDINKSLSILKECVILFKSLLQEGYTRVIDNLALTLLDIGKIYLEIGKYPEVEEHFKAVIELKVYQFEKELLYPESYAPFEVILDWHLNPNRPSGIKKAEALELAQRFIGWLDSQLIRVTDAAKGGFIEKCIPIFYKAIDLSIDLNNIECAYFLLERSKSRVLMEKILGGGLILGDQIDDELKNRYYKLYKGAQLNIPEKQENEQNIEDHSNQSKFWIPDPMHFDDTQEPWKENLDDYKKFELEYNQVMNLILDQDSTLKETTRPQPFNEEIINDLVPQNVLVIAFEQRHDFLRIYPITKEGIDAPIKIDLSQNQLLKRSRKFKREMNTALRITETKKIQNWLTHLLSDKFSFLIQKFCPEEILFVPHQEWHLLPLHLMSIEGQPISFLFRIRYIPSLLILRLIHSRPTFKSTEYGLIVADPDGTLQEAREEGLIVKKYMSNDQFLVGKQAKKEIVSQLLTQATQAHFACHGYYRPNLNGGLVLADGHLTAKELFMSLRTPNCKLIVLSACQTAQTSPSLADEYMGLISSFIFAGAQNVLASLWHVEETATCLLMGEFYKGLSQKLTPNLALQRAQKFLRDMRVDTLKEYYEIDQSMPEQPFREPFYWSGFILVGIGL